MHYVIISYDFAGTTIHNRARIEDKLRRDRYSEDDTIVTVLWSARRETISPLPRMTFESLPAFFGCVRPLYDLLSIAAVPYVLVKRNERPDVIIVQDFPLLWAARVASFFVGGEVILRLTNLPEDLAKTRGRFSRAYYRFHEMFAKRFADRYIVINDTTRNYLLRLGIPATRITVQAPNTIARDRRFIEAAKQKKGAARARHGIASDEPMILSVGRLEKEKAFDELIRVFAASDARGTLVIMGEGVLRAELEGLVHELGIGSRVVFAGWRDGVEKWEYYTDADAFVLLSKSEALGLVVWEAIYMNVPIIGRPVGGIKETIGMHGERGFFWDTANGPEAFKGLLEQCYACDGEVTAMIARGRAYVEERAGTP